MGVHSFHLHGPGTPGNKPVRGSEHLDRADVRGLRHVYRWLRRSGLNRAVTRSLIYEVFSAGRMAGFCDGLARGDRKVA